MTFDVTAADAVAAAEEGVRVLAAIQPELEVVEVKAQRAIEQERQLRESNVPELLGVAELAQALGVSRQRVSELTGTDGFPAPLVRLRSGPVWQRSALGRFLAQWPRKSGRPRKARETVTP
ncbi:MAG TPA: hypothetical protein VKK19_05940 [Candidatus Dormibacteraeota bacterium]|nr:hypothetical protein [Candidatus Dormibacteraeota bacterium]